MKRELTGMNLIIKLIVVAVALMMIIGLAIPLVVINKYFYYDYSTFQLNGFNTLLGHEWLEEFSGAVAAVNWVLLLAGLTCIIFASLSIIHSSNNKVQKFEIIVLIIGIISALLYMIEGIVIAVESSFALASATTISPVLFSIQLALLIAYFVCKKYRHTNTEFSTITQTDKSNNQALYIRNIPNQNTNNINSAEELIKYKQLLDIGIISQEEFDKKKRELLGL